MTKFCLDVFRFFTDLQAMKLIKNKAMHYIPILVF